LPTGTAQALAVSHRPEVPGVDAPVPRDGYVRFHVCTGERVSLYYPLAERSATYEVGSGERIAHCIGYWRGETLMRVEPPGPFYPLYELSAGLEPVQPALPAGAPLPSL
jgi:hypothetical protein